MVQLSFAPGQTSPDQRNCSVASRSSCWRTSGIVAGWIDAAIDAGASGNALFVRITWAASSVAGLPPDVEVCAKPWPLADGAVVHRR